LTINIADQSYDRLMSQANANVVYCQCINIYRTLKSA